MKEIPGFRPYCATRDGRIFSLDWKGTGQVKELKQEHHRLGYRRVWLKDRKTPYVHQLIALTFLPNPDNLPEVDHLDGNKANNHTDNLEWVSPSENMRRATVQGLNTVPNNAGTRNGMAKLTEEDVKQIKLLLKLGDTQLAIAKHFNISQGHVASIKAGTRWGHVALIQ